MTYSIVWFKRDLRLHDHAALWEAAQHGPVLCLYVLEPSFWAQPDAAHQHFQFLQECLTELDAALQRRGGRLQVVTGEVVPMLARLYATAPFAGVYSHEETGNGLTFTRDVAVADWCKTHGVAWHEFAQFGVVRRLKSRNTWQKRWEQHVQQPCLQSSQLPDLRFMDLRFVDVPFADSPLAIAPVDMGIGDAFDPPQRQRGGRRTGLQVLHSFLTDRSAQYRGGISSPLSAPTACSRLSPYLAWGCVSLREVVQATRQQIAALPDASTRHKQGLVAFTSRLYWHCHFIQKLESEPALEHRNVHRGYDGLRELEVNPAHLEALMAGRTGWPLVDACVAMLRETGWINFRMRAMLVSVAAYPLWLHWRPVGLWLARQFLDYEPGIHWSQMQMQSGTTGINVPRVYNPIKQAHDHDPHGHFVRRWLPAMRRVPDEWLFEPWRMPPNLQQRYGVRVGADSGADIATPLVDLEAATRQAKARLFAVRGQPEVKAAKANIIEKHASRKRADTSRSQKKSKKSANPKTATPSNAQTDLQISLGF
jgi:deoxyribodipyrimidine photo-lyase